MPSKSVIMLFCPTILVRAAIIPSSKCVIVLISFVSIYKL